jgi:hypothetical protein
MELEEPTPHRAFISLLPTFSYMVTFSTVKRGEFTTIETSKCIAMFNKSVRFCYCIQALTTRARTMWDYLRNHSFTNLQGGH